VSGGGAAAEEDTTLRAVDEARSGGDAGRLAQALTAHGQALLSVRKAGAAVAPLREAESVAEAAGLTSAAAVASSARATALLVLGRLDEALESAIESLRRAESAEAPGTEAAAAHTIGMVYRNLGRAEEALRYFERAEETARRAGATGTEARALNEQGNVLAMLRTYPEAVKRQENALALARRSGDLYTAGCVANDLGLNLGQQGDLARARELVEEAYHLHSRNGSMREACLAAGNLAYYFNAMGRPVESRRWAEEALRLATSGGNPPEEEAARSALAFSLASGGSWTRAFEELARAYELRSQVSNAEGARRAADLGAFYEAERRNARIELLERDKAIQALELDREKGRRGLLLAGAVVLAILALLLGAGYRAKVRANLVIRRKNDELAAARDALDRLSRTDSLTGLANRRELESRLEEERLRSARSGLPFSVVMMDLDGFKAVNDAHGHAAGDAVLRHAATRSRELARSVDTVGRWGGEEFLFILPSTPLDGASKLAEKVRESLASTTVDVTGTPVRVTATFGVAESDGSRGEELVRRADEALYEGKRAGRDRVVAAAGRTVAPA
jgi:diguanylate cyclase (GGDEF)-like protein